MSLHYVASRYLAETRASSSSPGEQLVHQVTQAIESARCGHPQDGTSMRLESVRGRGVHLTIVEFNPATEENAESISVEEFDALLNETRRIQSELREIQEQRHYDDCHALGLPELAMPATRLLEVDSASVAAEPSDLAPSTALIERSEPEAPQRRQDAAAQEDEMAQQAIAGLVRFLSAKQFRGAEQLKAMWKPVSAGVLSVVVVVACSWLLLRPDMASELLDYLRSVTGGSR